MVYLVTNEMVNGAKKYELFQNAMDMLNKAKEYNPGEIIIIAY